MNNKNMLDSYFKITENRSSIKIEVIGGISTFLAMAYIIFVNPDILSLTGMDKGALITVTCIMSGLATLLCGVWAKAPFALAPGMGLNAFFTYVMVLDKKLPWETALGIVFISGLFFCVLALGGIRERIIKSIPVTIKLAVGAGIGLFIAFIGMQNLKLVIYKPGTLLSLGEFTPELIIGLIGVILICVLEIKKIPGGILLGIIITTIIGIAFGKVALPTEILALPPSIAPIAFKLDIIGAMKISFLGPIFSFMFIDLFDTLGTLISCSRLMDKVDEDGNLKNMDKMIYTDVFATVLGSVLGTSTVTTYVESSSGISSGARTGLASVVTAFLFFASLFFVPLVGIVPPFATAPALIVVGIYMFRNVQFLHYDNLIDFIPEFIVIVMIPFTFSISVGLSLGFLSHIILNTITGNFKKLNPTLIFIGALCLVNLYV